MSFDLAASLRRLKPEKRTGPLGRRGDDELPFVAMPVTAGQPLLLDTTVYIDALKMRLPAEVETLMQARQVFHSAIAVSELAHSVGRLDPKHHNTSDAVRAIRRAIDGMPAHRVVAPSPQTMLDAGILAGIVARRLHLPSLDRSPLFNDAVLFVQALEQGCCLLSRNVVDFDRLLQSMPGGRVLLYRQKIVARTTK